MYTERRHIKCDLIDYTLKPHFVDGQELPNWQEGPELVDYIKQLADDGWQLRIHGAGQEFIFEREMF